MRQKTAPLNWLHFLDISTAHSISVIHLCEGAYTWHGLERRLRCLLIRNNGPEKEANAYNAREADNLILLFPITILFARVRDAISQSFEYKGKKTLITFHNSLRIEIFPYLHF